MKRQWRAPNESDKLRKCRARNPYEKQPFYVEWNPEFHCWAKFGTPHILILVTEVLDEKSNAQK